MKDCKHKFVAFKTSYLQPSATVTTEKITIFCEKCGEIVMHKDQPYMKIEAKPGIDDGIYLARKVK